MLTRALADALAHAFPSRAKLAQMLHLHLEIDAADIPNGEDYREVVHKTVLWLASQGRTGELVKGALLANPGNPKMNALLEEITQLAKPVQGQIVRGEHRFNVEEWSQEERAVMEFSVQIADLRNQLAEMKTAIALYNQSKEWDTRVDDERNRMLNKELEVLREGHKATRAEIVAIKEWQKASQLEMVAFKEWRQGITTARETRLPQSYVRVSLAFIAFMVVAVCVGFYIVLKGPLPIWFQ